MNPSLPGWIKKYLHTAPSRTALYALSEDEYYDRLLQTGFIYGLSTRTVFPFYQANLLSPTELSKTNLFNCLIYCSSKAGLPKASWVSTLLDFYSTMEVDAVVAEDASRHTIPILEKYLHERVQTSQNLLQRNLTTMITNALLGLDVLAYMRYLNGNLNSKEFNTSMESLIMNTIYVSLNQKKNKSDYDELLTKLFEKSLRYKKTNQKRAQYIRDLNLELLTSKWEKRYLLDLACLTVWNDKMVEPREYAFITKLSEALGLSPQLSTDSILKVKAFVDNNIEKIPYLDTANPVKQFYKQTGRTVRILILRNKLKLTQEIRESGELMVLLSQSTVRELNKSEKKKVKSQLLDICKSVPSLAVFILPGGAILLPLLIKFIPELLPSAFQDNKIDP